MPLIDPLVPRVFPPERVVAGFTDRTGGVSTGPYRSLNLGGSTDDDPEMVAENRRILCEWADVDESRIAIMQQVHGAHFEVASTGGLYPDTDGLVTAEPELLVGVLVADCVPLLLYDPVTHSAGAIHCGWRSIVAGIAEKAIRLMGTTRGTSPSSILAVAGPAAGACCYEVGEDVAGHLRPSSVKVHNGKRYADLHGELTSRLIEAGLEPDHIETVNQCTICSDRFFSHRRDRGVTGRMMGFAVLRNIHEPDSGSHLAHTPTHHEDLP